VIVSTTPSRRNGTSLPITSNLLRKLKGSEHQVQCRSTGLELLVNEKNSFLFEVPLHASHKVGFRFSSLQLRDSCIKIVEYDLASVDDGLSSVYC
jgi:hypothetical protein